MADLHTQYCRILLGIRQGRGSLGSLLDTKTRVQAGADAALLQQWCYGVCRWYHRLDAIALRLLQRPLRNKDQDIHCLILLGLYQLYFMRTPDHAAVHATVEASESLRKPWARSLINAVLREAQRSQQAQQEAGAKDYSQWYSHPQWLLDRLKRDWPHNYRDILDSNNEPGPMTLRVNLLQGSREDYLALLSEAGIVASPDTLAPGALQLAQPVDVRTLSGFLEGRCSVQDAASQLVATLLPVANDMQVLDACAAPGGKTCALLETHPDLRVWAMDADATRLERVRDNLTRLHLNARLRQGDLTRTATLGGTGTEHANGTPTRKEAVSEPPAGQPPDNPGDPWKTATALPSHFDAILLDVPCSGTGVIRRHPDIKLLRTPAEVEALRQKQAALLRAAWPLVRQGGHLFYSTCSVLREENEGQITAFLADHADAQALPLNVPGAQETAVGAQLLPRVGGHDGFYYALLRKC
ncbi:MAG TPA: 16S rRNA (cytosine(967)-C(5))-methyltransferase [Hyphomicrobiales bacterium]|nr:16S rRNA (cytosine(967)-C(5))-methyltransferase [Hyphomicrobiales bacterium]